MIKIGHLYRITEDENFSSYDVIAKCLYVDDTASLHFKNIFIHKRAYDSWHGNQIDKAYIISTGSLPSYNIKEITKENNPEYFL